MKECLREYIKNYPEDLRSLVTCARREREKYGSSTYGTIGRLMERAVEEDSDVLMGIAYYHLAEYYIRKGDMDVAGVCLTSCIKYLQGTGPYEYIAGAYHVLGIAARAHNDTVTAMEHFDHAMKYCEDYGLDCVQALVLCNLADSYRQTGHLEEAMALYGRAQKCCPDQQDGLFYYNSRILSMVGTMHCLTVLGRPEEALACKERIRRMAECCEDCFVPAFAIETANTAVLFCQGRLEEALESAQRAGKALKNAGLLENYISILDYLHLLTGMEDYGRLTEALDILQPRLEKMKESELYLQVIRMRLEHGARGMEKKELLDGIEAFFKAYDMCRYRYGESALRSLDIRRKLRQIQEKQCELDLLNKKLLNSSLHDALTGLANRGYLNQHAEQVFSMAYKEKAPLGICLADIDYFKQLNDRYGHLAGDNCLAAVAEILKKIEEDNVFCARYGGDEFTMVFYNISAVRMKQIIGRVCAEVEALHIPNEDSPVRPQVTISMGGFCKVPEGMNRLWDFFSAADIALYKVKRGGKDRFQVEENFSKNIL